MDYFLITEVNLIISLLKIFKNSLQWIQLFSSYLLNDCCLTLPRVKQFEYVHFSSKGLATLWNSVHLVGLPTWLIY